MRGSGDGAKSYSQRIRPRSFHLRAAAPRRAMALSKLTGDEAGIVFVHLCNALEPRDVVYFSRPQAGFP